MTSTTPDPLPRPPREPAADLALRGTAVLPTGVVPEALILVSGTQIQWAGPAREADPRWRAVGRPEVIDHDGLILPGLVDLHCHGGGGESFPDCRDAAAARVAVQEHRVHGTTSLVASLVTASPDTLRERVRMLAPLHRDGEIAGIHLEGPFISAARKGAQNPAHIQDADAELVAELCGISPGAIATMTIAPESPGADRTIAALVAHGAVPSLGHSDATAAQMLHGIETSLRALETPGARSALPTATHLFNGMRPIHHRDPGPALACLDAAARGEMVVELIADGVHLAAETVRFALDLAAPGRAVLVTDAMAAAGMPDGRYRLGALDVEVSDGVATLAEGGSIAGGTAHLLDVVRFAVERAGVDLATAVHAASRVPARVLGAHRAIGSLETGLRADILLTGRDLEPQRVLRGGAWVPGVSPSR